MNCTEGQNFCEKKFKDTMKQQKTRKDSLQNRELSGGEIYKWTYDAEEEA